MRLCFCYRTNGGFQRKMVTQMEGKPNRTVGYYRYSSDKQTEDSIEAQRRACTAYAAAHGLQIVGEYVDESVSGKGSKTTSRTQYQKMLRDCDKDLFDTVLIHKYDRVARNIGEHINLEKKMRDSGISLIATAQDFGSSNEAKIMRTLMYALSEYYIDNLSDEVKKGHRETAVKGLHNGGYAPFGYNVADQQYHINELEAGYVRRIFQAAANREGFTAIVDELAAAGIKGKRGKPIKYTQIYEMLKNEKYTGVYLYSTRMEDNRTDRRDKPNAIRIENAIPAIIDKTLFQEVQRIMSERKQVGNKAGYLCSGLVYCSCGGKMHGIKSKKGNFERTYFYCSKKCGAPTVRMEDVDNAARKYLQELLTPDNQMKVAVALRRYNAGEQTRAADFNNAIKKEIFAKQDQYDKLMDSLSTGVFPTPVMADMGQKMQSLKDEMEALREAKPPLDYTTDQITAWLEALKTASDENAIHLLIERIDIKSKTDFNMTSTLKSVLGENGRGDRI